MALGNPYNRGPARTTRTKFILFSDSGEDGATDSAPCRLETFPDQRGIQLLDREFLLAQPQG